MKKSIIVVFSMLLLTGFVQAMPISTVQVNESISIKPTKIGGWAPVFFNNYDSSAINKINKNINAGRISAVKISYPHDRLSLANKIKQALVNKQSLLITCEELDLRDTLQTQYNHTQVIVTLYFI